jgi:hypothetical protein
VPPTRRQAGGGHLPSGRSQGDRCRHRGADHQDPRRQGRVRPRRGRWPQPKARRAHRQNGPRRPPNPAKAIRPLSAHQVADLRAAARIGRPGKAE